jgi:aminoglycoside phosphotransferase (APT) family kinase protein
MPAEPPAIDAGLARRLVDRQFPQWSELPIAPVDLDGWDHRSFRLGDELTVRLPSGDWYAEQVDKEQRWLPILAPQLPLPIPDPVARGEPDAGFPYSWSVYRWLAGEPAATARVDDLPAFATALARFLAALRAADATDGPPPGRHNFFRGAPLATYEAEALEALEKLGDEVPRDVPRGSEPRPLPRRARGRRRDVVTRPRLVPVEGDDHARRPPGARRPGGGARPPRHRARAGRLR